MQACAPTETGARLSIQTSSPIQQKSPRVRRHGNLIRTLGLTFTLLPTFAPNTRRRAERQREPGSHVDTRRPLAKTQSASLTREAPRSKPLAENLSKCTKVCDPGFLQGRRFGEWRSNTWPLGSLVVT